MGELKLPTMLSFIRDLPNVCSLTGLLCSVIAIYFAALGVIPAAMIAILWAVFFDWSDGLLARRMGNRRAEQRRFGAELDSLIDVVSFGVFPGVLLLSVGDLNPWFLPGAFLILAATVIRLSHFNVFGLDGGSYRGLAVDNNGLALAFACLFAGTVDETTFATALYVLVVALAALNVAPIRTPKMAGRWYYVLIAYVVALTGVYTWQLA